MSWLENHLTRNPKEVSHTLSECRWAVSMCCLGQKSFLFMLFDWSSVLLPPCRCSLCIWIWQRKCWCSGAGCGDPGYCCPLRWQTCLDDQNRYAGGASWPRSELSEWLGCPYRLDHTLRRYCILPFSPDQGHSWLAKGNLTYFMAGDQLTWCSVWTASN